MTARRAEAATRSGQLALPSTGEEAWRYSRIGELDLDRWAPSADAHRASFELPPTWAAAGATVRPAADLDAAPAAWGAVADGADVFAALGDAFAAQPLVVEVPRGAQLDEPLVVAHHLAGHDVAAFGRVTVVVGEGAAATVVERTTSEDDATVLWVPVTDLQVARGGRLRYLGVQELGPRAWQVGELRADVAQEADLRAGLVGLGGDYARLRTDCALSGRGANADLLAAYFGDGDQMLDFRTFQDHRAPDTTSNLLFKGAVGGRSRSVYTGLIRVERDARGTNAFQTNRNIKLSDDAWAESVPNLEIETNDVRCSHASTVGPVDPEQRFYLESRGVPPAVAERLIVAGFFDEVVRQLPVPEVADEVRAQIAATLDRVEGEQR